MARVRQYGSRKRTRSQIGRSNKAGGSAFERRVAKKMSQALFGDNNSLRRTPASGGYDALEVPGDIAYLAEPAAFPFVIECKRHNALDLASILSDPNHLLWEFWVKVRLEARIAGRHPALVFVKTKGRAIFIAYPKEIHETLFPNQKVGPNMACTLWRCAPLSQQLIMVVPLEAWLEALDKTRLFKLNRLRPSPMKKKIRRTR